jgi:hypothetical protein
MTTSLNRMTRRPPRFMWIGAIIVLVPVLLIYARFAIVEPIQNWQADDLAINYSAATVLRSGGFLYDVEALRTAHAAHIGPPGSLYTVLFLSYNNTPATALLFWPLTFLAFPAAQTVFVLVNNALYLLGIGLTLYMLRAGPVEVILSVTFCMLLFFYAVRQTFGLGQMNGVLVGLMAVSLALALTQHDMWSSGFIALAAVLKISPIVLLGFFIAQRRWRALLGAGLMGLGVLSAMVIFTGWDEVTYFVTQVLPAVGRGSAAFPNQSLLGALYRFSVPLVVIQSSDAIGDYPAIRAVWLVSAIGVLALTWWLTARAQLTERSQAAVGLSVFIVAGLLASGLTWDHYLLWLALPVIVLIVDWFQERWLKAIGFWAMLLIALGAISVPIPLQEALYRSIGPLGSALSTVGLVLLWILMLWRLRLLQRRQEVA